MILKTKKLPLPPVPETVAQRLASSLPRFAQRGFPLLSRPRRRDRVALDRQILERVGQPSWRDIRREARQAKVITSSMSYGIYRNDQLPKKTTSQRVNEFLMR